MKEEITENRGAARRRRPQGESDNVIASQAQHQVGIDQFALVPHLLILVQPGEGSAIRFPCTGERHRALLMRNPTLPFKACTTRLTERRNYVTQFRMDSSAVVTLVVVLHHDFPVGLYFIGEAPGNSQIAKRITLHSLYGLAELHFQRAAFYRCIARGKIEKDESTPDLHTHRVERKISFAEPVAFFGVWCVQQASVERISPLVVGTADSVRSQYAPAQLDVAVRLFSRSRLQAGAAVTAHVIVSLHLTIFVSDHQNGFSGYVQDQIISRTSHLLFASGAEPFPCENAFFFARKDLLRVVVRARQGFLQVHVLWRVVRH